MNESISTRQTGGLAVLRRWIAAAHPLLLLSLTTLLVFANTFGLDWTYDDFVVIVDNPDIRSLGDFFANRSPGRPLRELSYMLDYAIFGMKPAGWHLQQLFWHGLNGFLLMHLARRLGAADWLAAAVSLLFLVHPLQVESVASLGHRKELLLLSFALMALIFWLRQADEDANPWLNRCAALTCVLLAWMAKQTAVLIPVLLVMVELTLLPQERRWLTRGKWLWALGLLAVIAAGWVWWEQIEVLGGLTALISGILTKMNIHTQTLPVYVMFVLKSWSFMALRIVWPFDLAVEYLIPAPSGWLDSWVLTALLLALATLGLIVWSWRRDRPLCLALCCGLLLWLPVSNIIPGAYLAADRYFYAPSAGLFLALGLAASALPWRRVVAALLLFTTLPLAWLTWQQNRVWQDNLSLFTRAAQVSPTSTMALTGLGEAHWGRKEYDLAIPPLTRAAFNWNQPLSYYYLGDIYDRKGDTAQAARWYCLFLAAGDVPRKNIDKRKVAAYVEKKFGQRCR